MRIGRAVSRRLTVCTLVAGSLAFGASSFGQQIRWSPVDASDNVVSNDGTEIQLSAGGVTVELELKLSGWGAAPGNPDLGAFQGTLDASGYRSSDGEQLNAINAGTCSDSGDPCIQDEECGGTCDGTSSPYEGAYQAVRRCLSDGTDCYTHPFVCAAGFQDCFHNEEWVFLTTDSIAAVSTATINYEWGAVVMGSSGVTDDGTEKYGGTLIIVVPVGAAGSYTIGFDPRGTKTFFNDEFANSNRSVNHTGNLSVDGT